MKMGNQKLLKPYLDLCRRLGIRYVSPVLFQPGKENERAARVDVNEANHQKTNATSEKTLKEGSESQASGMPKKPSEKVQGKTPAETPGRAGWLTASEDGVQAMELIAFERDICDCQKCPLGKTRKHFVFGSGNPETKVLFVGEAPGGEEDAQGLPFVGEAGKLLTKIIESTKLWKRSEVFICNVLKCRPPGNRTPSPEEVEQCRPYLDEQIQILKPKFIMAMGATAAQTLLRSSSSVGKLRNKWHDFNGIPLRVTYHPAALLRNESYKKDVWEDMKELSRKYSETFPKA